MMRGY